MLFEVFLLGKNLPSIVIVNVVVIVLLSVDPATETILIPFGSSLLMQLGTYLDGFGVDLSLLTLVFWLFSIMEMISCK